MNASFSFKHALVAAALAAPLMASATQGVWDSSLPAESTTLAEWQIFDSLPVDATPDVAGAGVLTETSGTGFLTGGGSIYSFMGDGTAFTVTTDALAEGTWDIFLRVGSLGSVVKDVATLNGVEASRTLAFEASLGGAFGGDEQESLWHWTINGGSPLQFGFAASGPHLSLDQVGVYALAAPVPEPGTWALLAAGLGVVGLMSRRQKRHG